MSAVESAVQGMDVIVQMGADPRPEAPWDSLLHSNIIGVRNVFEAAVRAHVKRVVYASSIMVSWGYQLEAPYKALSEGRFDDLANLESHTVTHDWPPRPTGLYPANQDLGGSNSALQCRCAQPLRHLPANRMGQRRGHAAQARIRHRLVQSARRSTTCRVFDRGTGRPAVRYFLRCIEQQVALGRYRARSRGHRLHSARQRRGSPGSGLGFPGRMRFSGVSIPFALHSPSPVSRQSGQDRGAGLGDR